VYDGHSPTAEQKASLTLNGAKALVAYNGSMYVLSGNQVRRIPLNDDLPSGPPQPVLDISGVNSPFDLAIDSRGGMYVSSPSDNQVYKLNASGGVAKTFGLGTTPPAGGRPGDVRIDAGIFDDNGTVRAATIGLYPKWYGPGQAYLQLYGSPVGNQSFESVVELKSVKLKHVIDPDKRGFVITMAIPLIGMFKPTIRTLANFSATFGGGSKSWWADTNNKANVETTDMPNESRLYPECWTGLEFYSPAVKAWK
jgi:hypothetical protein